MKINRKILIANILICSIILADLFVFTPRSKAVLINRFSNKYTHTKGARHYNYFIHTSDNCKYEVSQELYNSLQENDTIKIYTSPVINMPLSLQYHNNGLQYSVNTGQLRKENAPAIALLISLAISLGLLLPAFINKRKNEEPAFVLQLLSVMLTVIVLAVIVFEKVFI